MSGSNSSAPGAAAPPEAAPQALSFTVYDVAAPDLGATPQRTRRGRFVMLLVLLVCAAPVVASYLMYFVLRPAGGGANYGALVTPTRAMPERALHDLDGRAVPSARLRGQWLLVVVAPASCGARCERLLHAQRQLREMLGRDRDRLDKVWLVTDDAMPAPVLRAAVEAGPAVTVLRYPQAALAQWLEPAAGQALEDHLYLVDPMGEWMMRFPAAFEPGRVKRDLERLLRASSSWDRPGR